MSKVDPQVEELAARRLAEDEERITGSRRTNVSLGEAWRRHELEAAGQPGVETPAQRRCLSMMHEHAIVLGGALLHNPDAAQALFATATRPGESAAAAHAR